MHKQDSKEFIPCESREKCTQVISKCNFGIALIIIFGICNSVVALFPNLIYLARLLSQIHLALSFIVIFGLFFYIYDRLGIWANRNGFMIRYCKRKNIILLLLTFIWFAINEATGKKGSISVHNFETPDILLSCSLIMFVSTILTSMMIGFIENHINAQIDEKQ